MGFTSNKCIRIHIRIRITMAACRQSDEYFPHVILAFINNLFLLHRKHVSGVQQNTPDCLEALIDFVDRYYVVDR